MKTVMENNKSSDACADRAEPAFTLSEAESRTLLEATENEKAELEACFDSLLSLADTPEGCREIDEKIASLKRAGSNIRKAYINTAESRDELAARWKDITKSRRKRRIIPAAPANSMIDRTEESLGHFAHGVNRYKLALLCFVGSFVGVVVEMLWCLLKNGSVESRAGLVYGPFNLLYGFGAAVLSLSLYRFRNRGRWLSFLGGMIVGSAVEYACSWGQEMVFGSSSWDYSSKPFNLNGRICLLYSVFWGLLSVVWVKNIYPRAAKLILKIPNKIGKALTVAVSVFLAVNAVVTCAAVLRWSQRKAGVESTSPLWQFVDDRFTDTRMEKIFPNMSFGE